MSYRSPGDSRKRANTVPGSFLFEEKKQVSQKLLKKGTPSVATKMKDSTASNAQSENKKTSESLLVWALTKDIHIQCGTQHAEK